MLTSRPCRRSRAPMRSSRSTTSRAPRKWSRTSRSCARSNGCAATCSPIRPTASCSPPTASRRPRPPRWAGRGRSSGCPTSRPMVPDAINLASVRRALVVKLRHHGDVLLASPVFTVLKNHAPHAEVDALVYSDTRDMLSGHPAITRIHVIDRAWKRQGLAAQARHEWELLQEIKERRYQVLVHLTSRWLFKTWTERKNAELLRGLVRDGHQVVLTGAPDPREHAIIARILAEAAVPVHDFSGKLTLREMAALSARARLFFGVDSAPMHIAAAMGTPVVALFGPTTEKEWGPWRVAHRIVTSAHPCRPCGNDGCGGGKVSECITELSVERVHSAVNELLSQR